jgi:poly-gamma-glutamate synthesis protein (capsule biosynthesis protein)
MKSSAKVAITLVVATVIIAGAVVFFGFGDRVEEVFEPQPPDLTARVEINMAGDFLLHTAFNRAARTGPYTYDYRPFLSEIKHYITGDLNITNIEGPVDAFGGNQNIASFPNFNYPAEILDAIKYAGFNFIITANNHAFDKGWSGLITMRQRLRDAGLNFLGTFESQEEHDEPYIIEINGIKIGITAWSALDNGLSFLIGEHAAYAMKLFNQDRLDDVPRMLEDVEKLREAGAEVVLMSLHWGAEYVDNPTTNQREIARRLAAGGVDIIMGNHTHCVQPIEIYENEGRQTLVIYSLGNFFADQLAKQVPTPKTQYGMIVSAVIERDSEGNIEISASYLPTLCYRDTLAPRSDESPHGYVVLPVGKYANMTEQPSHITARTWQETKAAWNHVRRVVGDSIPAR